MQIALMVALCVVGGGAFYGIGVGSAVLISRSMDREVYGPVMMALAYFGPGLFASGAAFTWYAWRWLDVRESQWAWPAAVSGVLILGILTIQTVMTWKGRF